MSNSQESHQVSISQTIAVHCVLTTKPQKILTTTNPHPTTKTTMSDLRMPQAREDVAADSSSISESEWSMDVHPDLEERSEEGRFVWEGAEMAFFRGENPRVKGEWDLVWEEKRMREEIRNLEREMKMRKQIRELERERRRLEERQEKLDEEKSRLREEVRKAEERAGKGKGRLETVAEEDEDGEEGGVSLG